MFLAGPLDFGPHPVSTGTPTVSNISLTLSSTTFSSALGTYTLQSAGSQQIAFIIPVTQPSGFYQVHAGERGREGGRIGSYQDKRKEHGSEHINLSDLLSCLGCGMAVSAALSGQQKRCDRDDPVVQCSTVD